MDPKTERTKTMVEVMVPTIAIASITYAITKYVLLETCCNSLKHRFFPARERAPGNATRRNSALFGAISLAEAECDQNEWLSLGTAVREDKFSSASGQRKTFQTLKFPGLL